MTIDLEQLLVDAVKYHTQDSGQYVHRNNTIPGYLIPAEAARLALRWLSEGKTTEEREQILAAKIPPASLPSQLTPAQSRAANTAALLAGLSLSFSNSEDQS